MPKKKILLVDDDPISLHLPMSYLTEEGYSCVLAENGEQALEILVSTPEDFSLVIADRVMPKLHGVELIQAMRKIPRFAKIPVIMLTALAEKAEMIEATALGAFDFLYKPIEKDLLLAVVKKALK